MKPTRGALLNPTHPLSRGLIGAWLMTEGGADLICDWVNGNNATMDAGSTWVGTPHGAGVSFDKTGNENAETASRLLFTPQNGLTLSLMVYIRSTPSQISGGIGTSGNQWYFALRSIARPRFTIGATQLNYDTNISGAWRRVTCRWMPSVIQDIWIDGAQVATHETPAASMSAASTAVWINRITGTAPRECDADYADVFLWDRCLLGADVRKHAEHPYEMFESTLVPAIFGDLGGGEEPAGDEVFPPKNRLRRIQY